MLDGKWKYGCREKENCAEVQERAGVLRLSEPHNTPGTVASLVAAMALAAAAASSVAATSCAASSVASRLRTVAAAVRLGKRVGTVAAGRRGLAAVAVAAVSVVVVVAVPRALCLAASLVAGKGASCGGVCEPGNWLAAGPVPGSGRSPLGIEPTGGPLGQNSSKL